ncbi:MAG: uncharacterized protein KVP18_003929 [Porospora cf. gigantea A]|uniref:uncharacterized protein n=1 Tax=Porospora cf. gigantea A TaxID=2853593 RepID=UPI003559F023|nr:MAG: hypothetical protein KVP18_003929 [Porospora cf. gigantea A]
MALDRDPELREDVRRLEEDYQALLAQKEREVYDQQMKSQDLDARIQKAEAERDILQAELTSLRREPDVLREVAADPDKVLEKYRADELERWRVLEWQEANEELLAAKHVRDAQLQALEEMLEELNGTVEVVEAEKAMVEDIVYEEMSSETFMVIGRSPSTCSEDEDEVVQRYFRVYDKPDTWQAGLRQLADDVKAAGQVTMNRLTACGEHLRTGSTDKYDPQMMHGFLCDLVGATSPAHNLERCYLCLAYDFSDLPVLV